MRGCLSVCNDINAIDSLKNFKLNIIYSMVQNTSKPTQLHSSSYNILYTSDN